MNHLQMTHRELYAWIHATLCSAVLKGAHMIQFQRDIKTRTVRSFSAIGERIGMIPYHDWDYFVRSIIDPYHARKIQTACEGQVLDQGAAQGTVSPCMTVHFISDVLLRCTFDYPPCVSAAGT